MDESAWYFRFDWNTDASYYELLYLGASICGIVFLLVFWKKIRFYQTPYEWSAPFMNLGKRAGIVFGNIGMILFVILSIMEFAWNL